MARRLRPLLLRLLQTLCVAALVWLLWPETIPMQASAPGARLPAKAPRPAPAKAVPAQALFLAGDLLLDGRPVAGRVTLSGPVRAETVADEAGGFRFPLGPTYQWLAAARESDGEGPASWGSGDSVPVTVCADAGAHVACETSEVVLGEEPARLRLELAVGGILSGRVVDEHGRPRAGATVQAAGDGGPTLEARTAPDGRFLLSAPPGSYQVSASAPRTLRAPAIALSVEPGATREVTLRLWSAAHLSGIVVGPKGARVRFEAVSVRSGQRPVGRAVQPSKGRFEVDGLLPGTYRVEVKADGYLVQEFEATAPADDLRLALQPGLSLVGTVFDTDGLPHAGARVVALPEERMTRELGGALTDDYGSFRIDGLAPGVAYYVAAFAEPGPGRSSASAAERVILFERTSGLNLRFEPGRTIGGQVVDSRGRPVPGASIEAFPDGVARVQGPLARYRATYAQADERGAFTLENLRFDRYRVFAHRDGYARRGDSLALVSTGEAKARLVLWEEGSIRGRVLRPDGAPAIELRVNGAPVSSADGRFTLPVRSPGPTIDLTVEAKGFAREVRRVQAGRGVDVTLGDLVLSPARALGGEVVDAATGEPVADAFVALAAADLPDTEEARARVGGPELLTGPQGRFVLADAPPSGTLVVRRRGYLSAAVALTPGLERCSVALQRGVTVAGRVAASRELGSLTMARVVLTQGQRSMAGEVEPDGSFSVEGLWPGAWDARLVDPERAFDLLPASVEVPSGGVQDLVLRMRDGGARLTVTGLWEQTAFLVPGQAALPRDQAGYLELSRRAISGEQGLDGALFRSVEPGEYTLFVGQEEGQGRELGYYTLPVVVRGLEPQAVQARAPKHVNTLPIPAEGPAVPGP